MSTTDSPYKAEEVKIEECSVRTLWCDIPRDFSQTPRKIRRIAVALVITLALGIIALAVVELFIGPYGVIPVIIVGIISAILVLLVIYYEVGWTRALNRCKARYPNPPDHFYLED